MIEDELKKILAFSKCKRSLVIYDKYLKCIECYIEFPVFKNIPNMLIDHHKLEIEKENLDVIKKRHQRDSLQERYVNVSKALKLSNIDSFSKFMNYGYVSDSNEELSCIDTSDILLNRSSVKLSLEVIGDLDIDHKIILEVGCGRGGNLGVVGKYFKSSIMIGMDLCEKFMEFCHRDLPHVNFLIGDAECLPIRSQSVDIILNIESSHSYPSVQKFWDLSYSS